jgi:CRP/FNR family transcriptional regulator
MDESLSSVIKKIGQFGIDFEQELAQYAVVETFPPKTELVREGQYVKYIPLVISGLVKVYTQFEDKELLLYYIQPEQSCIMSFSSCIHDDKSKIYAITEEETTVLLMPADKVLKWIRDYPSLNLLFYRQYDLRYNEMIDTIHHMLYHKLDKRLMDYLLGKVKVTGKNPIKISHREIANDLGTAREVISRLVKKLENQGQIIQHHDSIELISE